MRPPSDQISTKITIKVNVGKQKVIEKVENKKETNIPSSKRQEVGPEKKIKRSLRNFDAFKFETKQFHTFSILGKTLFEIQNV